MARCFLRHFKRGHRILFFLLLAGTLEFINGDNQQALTDIDPNGACKAEIALHCQSHKKITDADLSAAAAKAAGKITPRGHVHPAGTTLQQQQQQQQHQQQEEHHDPVATTAAASGGHKRTLLDTAPETADQKHKHTAAALQQLQTKLNLPYPVTDPAKLLAGPNIARCLKNIMLNPLPSATYGAEVLSPECLQDVVKYYSDVAADTAKDYQLIAACAEDILAHCPNTASSSLFICLLSNKHKAKRICAAALSTRTAASAGLLKWNQELAANCQGDAARYCVDELQSDDQLPGVGGFAMGCLGEKLQTAVEQSMTGDGVMDDALSDKCAQAIFRREMADSEDIRFSFELSRACGQELSLHCPRVNPARGEAVTCLERQLEDLSLGDECQLALQSNQLLRAADGRLDWQLREHCRKDVLKLCSDDKEYSGGLNPALMLDDWDAPPMAGMNVTLCLRRKWQFITSASCKTRVRYITARAFANTLLDGPLLRACAANITQHCMEPDNALVCLKKLKANGLKLAPACGDVLQERLLEAADDYDLLPDVVKACKAERKLFCEGVPAAHGAVLDCLADFQTDDRFGEGCREALTGQFMLAVSDIRLLSSLHKGCESDTLKLCPGVKPGSGRVIECLQENGGKITSSSCRRQLLRLQGFAAHDYRLDYHLREACSLDVSKHCSHVVPGNGRMHTCLRKNMSKLGKDCREHVQTAEAREFQEVSINPSIHSACESTITALCGKLKGSIAELTPCLKQRMADPSFAPSCKKALTAALARKGIKYGLQPAVQEACDADVSKLCPEVAKARAQNDVIVATLTTTTAKRMMMAMAAGAADEAPTVAGQQASTPRIASTSMQQHLHQIIQREPSVHISTRSIQQATTAAAAAAVAEPTTKTSTAEHDPELVCLAKHLTELSLSCKQEVAAEVHRELVLYMPGMPLTTACDADARQLCNAGSADVSAILQPGSILGCLVTRPEKLSPGCWEVVSLFDKEQLAFAKRLESGGSEASGLQLAHTQQPQKGVQDAVLEKVSQQLQQQVASQIQAHFQTQWRAQPDGPLSSEVERYIASVAKGAQSSGFLFGVLASVVLLAVAAGIMVVVQRGKGLSRRITRAPDGSLVVKDGNV